MRQALDPSSFWTRAKADHTQEIVVVAPPHCNSGPSSRFEPRLPSLSPNPVHIFQDGARMSSTRTEEGGSIACKGLQALRAASLHDLAGLPDRGPASRCCLAGETVCTRPRFGLGPRPSGNWACWGPEERSPSEDLQRDLPAKDPTQCLREAVDLIVIAAIREGEDLALELAEPGCRLRNQHMAGFDPRRLH